MSFIISGSTVLSFAEYTDLLQKDQRVLVNNELTIPAESGFTDITDYVEDMLTKSTGRILLKMKASSWWQAYNSHVGNNPSSLAALPNVDPSRIDPSNTLGRQQQFTDLTVYYCMKEYLLPLVGQFELDSNDVAKIEYYDNKFNDLFSELLSMADWYDADDDGTVDLDEQVYSYAPTRRTRRRRTIVKVR